MTVAGVGYLRAFNQVLDAFYSLNMASTNTSAGDITSAAFAGVSLFRDLQQAISPTFTALTLASGFVSLGTPNTQHEAEYNVVGDRVHIRGSVAKSASHYVNGDVILTLPANARSTNDEYFVGSRGEAFFKVNTNGDVEVEQVVGGNITVVVFNITFFKV